MAPAADGDAACGYSIPRPGQSAPIATEIPPEQLPSDRRADRHGLPVRCDDSVRELNELMFCVRGVIAARDRCLRRGSVKRLGFSSDGTDAHA